MEPLPNPSERRLAATEAHHRRTLMGLGVAFIGLLLIVVVVQWFTDTGQTEGVSDEIRQTVFETLDGSSLRLDDFDGTPVVLNFFASWCGPCRTEMPEFQEVSEELGDAVQFVGLNARENDPDAAQRLIDASGVTYPIALGATQSQMDELDAIVMPTTVVYKADGTRCRVWSGAINATDLTSMIQECSTT